MTTPQRYPATLPPEREQAIADIAARIVHELRQAHIAAAEWQRQAKQHEADLVAERKAHEATKAQLQETANAYEYERKIRMAVMRRRDTNRRWARAWKRVAKRYLGAFESANVLADEHKARWERLADSYTREAERRMQLETELEETQAAVARQGVGDG